MEAFPAAAQLVPELRMIVVAGPRIDPATLPAADGLEVRAFVEDLYRHLAACDLAVVQGGLTTAMELTAAQRQAFSRACAGRAAFPTASLRPEAGDAIAALTRGRRASSGQRF